VTRPRRTGLPRAALPSLLLSLLSLLLGGCQRAAEAPPDALLVIWDTARADHLSAYGYPLPTTPWLERFQAEAATFHCFAPGSNTIASHGSLFTGLPPSEHGATFVNRRLPADHETLAERLEQRGYATFLYSANPSVSALTGFDQGFEHLAHPWDQELAEQARQVLRRRVVDGDNGTGVAARLRAGELEGFDLAPVGEVAVTAFEQYLAARAARRDERPLFAVLNLMDAHFPLLPGSEARAALIPAADRAASSHLRRGWGDLWRHVAGVEPYAPEELRLATAVYDAALRELDGHTERLVDAFDRHLGARAERALVAITSDHGEHLGEVHGGLSLLDHRYTLHDELLRVPLVVRARGHLPAGTAPHPVGLQDLHPTLLQLAGVEPAPGPPAPGSAAPFALDLRAADRERPLFSEYLGDFGPPVGDRWVAAETWAATGLGPALVAVRLDGEAWVGPAGDAARDPAGSASPARELARAFEAGLRVHPRRHSGPSPLSEAERAMLERLGYGDVGGADD
jgi:arylsulfatase A-like enzyme